MVPSYRIVTATCLLVLILLFPAAGFSQAGHTPGEEPHAQAGGSHAVEHSGSEHGDPMLVWKIANFAIFLGIILYFGGKFAPKFFASRTAEIRSRIEEASRRGEEARLRAEEIERRISRLEEEVAQIRGEAEQELAQEAARIEEETRQAISRIQEQARQQIALSTRAHQQDLKRYAAGLAVLLAQQRLPKPLSAQTERALADQFLQAIDGLQAGAEGASMAPPE